MVRLVIGVQSALVIGKIRGVSALTLGKGVRFSGKKQPTGAGGKPMSPKQAELAQMHTENVPLWTERDIPDDDLLRQGIPVMYACITKLKTCWLITLPCDSLSFSASRYFECYGNNYAANPSLPDTNRRTADKTPLVDIKAKHAEFKEKYN